MKKDRLFQTAAVAGKPFEFNQSVVDVFADMIERSVPIYRQTLGMAHWLAGRVVGDGQYIYDLGCSEGAALLAARDGIKARDVTLVGVDNSAAMLASARQHLDRAGEGAPVTLLEDDIGATEFSTSGLVMLNFTLQFVPSDERDALLARIYAALAPGGALLLSEKIRATSARIDAVLIDRHEDFKRANAYSELEIARKRESLENVLVPDTPDALLARLAGAGFTDTGVWLQSHNFLSILALR